MNKQALKNGLNNIYADRVSRIPAHPILVYGEASFNEIRSVLNEWERLGYLSIIKDIEEAKPDEDCIVLHGWIK